MGGGPPFLHHLLLTIHTSIVCCQSLFITGSSAGFQFSVFTSKKQQQQPNGILSRMKLLALLPPRSDATMRSVAASMMFILPPSVSKPSTTFLRVSQHRFSSSATTTTTSSSSSSSFSNIIPSSKKYSTMMITMMSSSKRRVLNFPKNHPFAMNLIVATSKTCAADIVVQTCVEKKKLKEIDWKRNGIFVIFGFVYLGGFQWWLLINKFQQWFPTMEKFGKLSFSKKLQHKDGIKDAIKMIAFDVIIHSPIVYFPTYYTVKESIGGKKGNWNPIDWFYQGVTNYKKNIFEDLKAMVTVTIPSDCIQVILPLHLRMIVRHFVSFFWTSYISFSRGAINEKQK